MAENVNCELSYRDLQAVLRYFRDDLGVYVPNKLNSSREVLEELLKLALRQIEKSKMPHHSGSLFDVLYKRAVARGYTHAEATALACWLIDNAHVTKREKQWKKLMEGLGLTYKK